jgi:hypothetical protein
MNGGQFGHNCTMHARSYLVVTNESMTDEQTNFAIMGPNTYNTLVVKV